MISCPIPTMVKLAQLTMELKIIVMQILVVVGMATGVADTRPKTLEEDTVKILSLLLRTPAKWTQQTIPKNLKVNREKLE
jgi:hypothetical protein